MTTAITEGNVMLRALLPWIFFAVLLLITWFLGDRISKDFQVGAYAIILLVAAVYFLYWLVRLRRKRDLNAEMKAVEDAMRKESH
jgi:membrane protein DedA with SNARE-associated domain